MNELPSQPKISGEARKAELLEAALGIIFEKGYVGAGLQEIAERVGILKGSVYYYYQSKEDLLFDILKQVHDEHLENARSLSRGGGDPLSRLKHLLAGHAAFLCRNAQRTAVLLRELRSLSAERGADLHRQDQEYETIFRTIILDAKATGQVSRSLDDRLAALWIIGSLNWLHRWYRVDRSRQPDVVGEEVADHLMRGIATSSLWPPAPMTAPLSKER